MANNNILHVLVLVGLIHCGVSQIINDYCEGVGCPSNQYCVEDEGCVPKKPLDEACTETIQCEPMYSECVGEDEASKTCQCGRLWVPGPENQCILDCSTTNCSKAFFCSEIYHGCLPKYELNDRCDISEPPALQCKTLHAICEGEAGSETCTCDFKEQDGACIPSCTADSSRCRPEIEFCDSTTGDCLMKKYLGQVCTISNECMTPNSECGGENVCSCVPDFVNKLNISCVPECSNNDGCPKTNEYCDIGKKYCVTKANLNQPCHIGSQDQCSTLNAECDDPTATCKCSENFQESNNQCIPFCANHNNCDEPWEFCNPSSNVCQSKGHLGEECSAENESYECIDSRNGTDSIICTSGRCTCSPDHYQSGGNCIVKCTESSSCNEETEFCNIESGKCTPKVDLNGICKPLEEGNPCKTQNAICHETTNRCTCIPSHVENSGTCIVKCSSNAQCTSVPDQFCNSGTGACEMKHNLNQECDPEEANDQCKNSNSACTQVEDKAICSCNQNFIENNEMCVPTCMDSSTCDVNMYCDKNSTICKPKSSLGQDCMYPDQCRHANSECTDNKCSCNSEHYNYHNGACLKKCTITEGCLSTQFCRDDGQCEKKKQLGEDCGDDFHCQTASAVCNSICQCPLTHWENGDKACIQKCTKTTVCNDAQFCSSDEKCYAKIGYDQTCGQLDDERDQCIGNLIHCSTLPELTRWKCLCVDNAEKATGTGCTCSDSYVESQDVLRCLKEAAKIGDQCEEVQQCFTLGESESTQCSTDSKCSCNPDYVGNSQEVKCLKKATELLQPCEDNNQCEGIGNGNTGAECSSGQCKCKVGFQEGGDKKTCVHSVNGSTRMSYAAFTIIAAFIIHYFTF